MGPLAAWLRRKLGVDADVVEDPLLGSVKRGIVAQVGALATNYDSLDQRLVLLAEDHRETKRLERLIQSQGLVVNALKDDMQRLEAAIQQVRGMATGGRRGNPAQQRELEAGRRFLEACSDPQQLAQLIANLQQLANGAHVEGVGGVDPQWAGVEGSG